MSSPTHTTDVEANPTEAPAADPFKEFLDGTATLVGSPRHWFHLYFPSRPFTTDLDLLMTECGADQQVRLALANPDNRISTMHSQPDVLQQVAMYKRAYALDNLTVIERAPEELDSLGLAFDLIFASGEFPDCVDPAVALRALRSVLRPDGSINMKLHGRYGRSEIHRLQQLLGVIGVQPGPAGEEKARDLIAKVRQSDSAGEAEDTRRAWMEDPQLSEVLLRAQEETYDIPDALSLLERSGLRLQRLMYQAPYLAECSELAATPDLVSDVSALPEYEQYAVMELFRGTMSAHEIVACRDDRSEETFRVTFEREEWLRYVPVRNPALQIAQENLPDRAVARLRWPAHPYPEIAALIDTRQAELFNAVDDRRTIATVMAEAGMNVRAKSDQSFARNFFESMWSFDYMWFRTSVNSTA